MTTRKIWSLWLLAGTLVAVVPTAQAQEEVPQSLDDEFAQQAEEVPGFGGLYLDEEGVTHVYLQDLSREREVQGLGERVVVQQGDYDFRDLLAWKDEVRPQLTERGAVYLDIDERRNRLVFGVEQESLGDFSARLETFLRDTRVPPAAVLVEVAEPIEPLQTLNDWMRPIPAGVQIHEPGGAPCTLGVNSTRLGVRGFVTASHCTTVRSVVEGTDFFQHVVGTFNWIGSETADPAFFTGGPCPPNRFCRRSDAAFVAYSSPSISAGGKLANVACSFGPGTHTIDAQVPRLPVTGFIFGTPVTGSIVYKTGRTTGCTYGLTIGSCVDSNVFASAITLLCQNRVGGLALPGDSGSPVYFHGGDHVTLTGVLWGGGPGSFVYSPWLFVHGELGGLIPDAP